MSDFRRDFETWDQYAKRLAAQDGETPDDEQPTPQAPQLPPLTIRPGAQYVTRAIRAGREDEYSDRMRAKYGGEW